MSRDTGKKLGQCLELLTKIRQEYPEGDLDREVIHGEMDFRYRQIKEDREKLEAFPKEIREFARLLESLASPHEEVKKFLQLVSVQPHKFSPLANLQFHERQKRLEAWAAKQWIFEMPQPIFFFEQQECSALTFQSRGIRPANDVGTPVLMRHRGFPLHGSADSIPTDRL